MTPPESTYSYIFYSFKSLLSTDVIKRGLSCHELEGHNPQAPQVDSHIILNSLQNLRGNIVKSATIGFPPLVAHGSPAEITQLVNILDKKENTFEITMFYGLRSRCAIPKSWRCSRASVICRITMAASFSFSFPFLRISYKVPPSIYSSTIYRCVLSSKNPYKPRILRWWRQIWRRISRASWSTIMWDFTIAFGIFFRANNPEVFLCLAKFTQPNLPYPSFFPT